jgi:hypothetical protein
MIMPALILHRMPFGGVAFEPVTDAGADWLADYASEADNVFRTGDACMEGLPYDAIGFEPRDAADVVESALIDRLTVGSA